MVNKDGFALYQSWENCLRGWTVFDDCVQIEPIPQEISFSLNQQDDGRLKLFNFKKRKEVTQEIQPIANIFQSNEQLVAFSVRITERDYGIETHLNILNSLGDSLFPITFEIEGTETEISFRFICYDSDKRSVSAILSSYFGKELKRINPELTLNEFDEFAIIDFGLENSTTNPLSTIDDWKTESIFQIASLLEDVKNGEYILFQFQFQGAEYRWDTIIAEAIMKTQLDGLYHDDSTRINHYEEKFSNPTFCSRMRVVANANSFEDRIDIAIRSIQALGVSERKDSNRLIPLSNVGLSYENHFSDVLSRTFHRPGFLISGKELAILVKIPQLLENISKFKIKQELSVKAPDSFLKGKYCLGVNKHEKKVESVYVGDVEKLKHHLVIGSTGVGKSSYIVSMAVEDAKAGNGFTVLDPHGDLIEDILKRVPDERLSDIVLLDPSDSDFPIGFNLLDAHSESEEIILSSDLVSVFKSSSTSWGDQMTSILSMAISVFLEREETGTLLELQHFLQDEKYRRKLLTEINDPIVKHYWSDEFPNLRKGTVAPILTRLGSFLRPKVIRNMMAIRQGVNFHDILSSKRIVLVKLAQGQIGEENSEMLGKLVLSKLYQAALSRQNIENSARHPHYLYIDEFHNFISPSFKGILTGIRKYGLGLTCSCQNLVQLNKVSGLREIILSNAFIRSTFRLGDDDAQVFSKNSVSFSGSDYANLKTGEVILRIGRADDECTLKTELKELQRDSINEIRERSRLEFARRKEDVQNDISVLFEPSNEKEKPIESNAEEIQVITENLVEIDDFEKSKEEYHKSETRKIEKREHILIQERVQVLAHKLGWKAELEKTIGKGRVDVYLNNGNLSIAVEVSVTNTDVYELQSIKNSVSECDFVILISPNTKKRHRIKESIDSATETVFVFSEREFEDWLLFNSKPQEHEEKIGGYDVKVKYDSNVAEEDLAKKVIDILRNRKKG